MKKIALFGGSFDPVHKGHLALANLAFETAGLDRVIFVPCWQSPFKGRTVAKGEQRYEMLLLAVEESGFDWAGVSDFEILRPEPSYSWQTVDHFAGLEPEGGVEWFWILGTDQWNQIEDWAEPEKLRSRLHFLVATRDRDAVTPKPGWRHTPLPFAHPASATMIRGDLEKHASWLPETVRDYCRDKAIYRHSKNK